MEGASIGWRLDAMSSRDRAFGGVFDDEKDCALVCWRKNGRREKCLWKHEQGLQIDIPAIELFSARECQQYLQEAMLVPPHSLLLKMPTLSQRHSLPHRDNKQSRIL